MKELLFDHQNITRPDPEVTSAMLPYLHEKWGIPTSVTWKGQELIAPLKEAYEAFYALFNASGEEQFLFTSSGAEAVNQVIFSAFLLGKREGKTHFVTSELDEAPAILAQNRLEELGATFSMAKANSNATVTKEALLEVITPRTALISLSSSSGLVGTVHDIEPIAALCQERGILLHVDISHSLLVADLSTHVDVITFSGDLIHGPRASGGLFVKAGVELHPLILGGNEQGGLRAGPLDVASFIGLSEAAHLVLASRDHMCTEIARLKALFETRLAEKINGCIPLFANQERLPHISAMYFPKVSHEALLYLLNTKQVAASFGGGHLQQIARFLEACQLEPEMAQSSLSFAFSRNTTQADIEEGVDKVVEAVRFLQRASCHLPEECLK